MKLFLHIVEVQQFPELFTGNCFNASSCLANCECRVQNMRCTNRISPTHFAALRKVLDSLGCTPQQAPFCPLRNLDANYICNTDSNDYVQCDSSGNVMRVNFYGWALNGKLLLFINIIIIYCNDLIV